MPQNPLIPGASPGRLIPAKDPNDTTFQAKVEGADTFVWPGEQGTAKTDGALVVGEPSRIAKWMARHRAWDEEFRREIWPDAQRYWKLYRNDKTVLPQPAQNWRDDTIIPTVFKIIETLTPRQVLMEWSGNNTFTIEGVEGQDEKFEQIIKKLLETQLDHIGRKSHDGNFIARKIEGKRYTNIMGHSWTKFWWRDEVYERTLKVPDPANPSKSQWVKALDQHYRGLDYAWLPMTSVAVDMSGAYRWHIEIIKTTLQALQRENANYMARTGQELYHNLDVLESQRMMAESITDNTENPTEPEDTEEAPVQWPTDPGDTEIELWLCWDNFEKTLTKIANRTVELDHGLAPTPNGLAPYIPQRALTVPGRVYGESLIKYIGPLAVYQTRIARARADEVMLNIWQQFIFRSDSVISAEWLHRPGGWIEVDTEPGEKISDTFTQFSRRPVFQEAYSEEGYRQQQAESAAGADAISQGVEATNKSRDVSATEIKQRVMQGSARWQLGNLESEVITKKRELESAYDLVRQNLTEPEIIRVIGEDGLPEDHQVDIMTLEPAVDIKVGGGLHEQALADKKQALKELMTLAVGNTPFAQALNPQAVLALWFEANDFKNPKRFLKSQETVQNDQAQQQLMAAMASGMAKGPGEAGMAGGPGGPSLPALPPGGGPATPTAGLALPAPTPGTAGPEGPSGPGGAKPPPSPAASETLVEEV